MCLEEERGTREMVRGRVGDRGREGGREGVRDVRMEVGWEGQR